MKNKTRIAILLATYNGEKFLADQFESLLSQTYQDFTVFISDDGSTDRTVSIINSYAKKYPKKFININNKIKHGGPRDNFLDLAKNVDSELYMFSDQDDIWLPEKIEKTLAVYEKSAKSSPENLPILAYSDMQVVDQKLEVLIPSLQAELKKPEITMDWKFYVQRNNIAGCVTLFNRPLVDLFQKADQHLDRQKIIMHDYLFILLAALAGKIVYCDSPLILYRQHGHNAMGAFNEKADSFREKLKVKHVTKNLTSAGTILEQILDLPEVKKAQKRNLPLLEKCAVLYQKNHFSRTVFLVTHRMCYFNHKSGAFFKNYLRWLAGNILL